MSTRSLAYLAVALVLIVGIGAALASASPAKAEPAIQAVPARAADSYIVSGSGFDPGAKFYVFDESACGGETRCGGGDYSVGEGFVSASGTFTVNVQLDSSFRPSTGQTHRALSATQDDWNPEQLAQRPFIQVPLSHPGSPGAPNVGNAQPGTGPVAWADVAVVAGLVLLGAAGALSVLRRRGATR